MGEGELERELRERGERERGERERGERERELREDRERARELREDRELERELRAALLMDEKYKRENEAKLRAVQQRVGTYEEFRDIVLASHLKPLDPRDKRSDRRPGVWNPRAQAPGKHDGNHSEISQASASQLKSAADFHRDWRRCHKSGPEKYAWLLQLGGPRLGKIFQAELGFGFLGEFLVILSDHFQAKDRLEIYQILQNFSETKRFSLNVEFLSSVERERSAKLFQCFQEDDDSGLGGGKEAKPVPDQGEKPNRQQTVNNPNTQHAVKAVDWPGLRELRGAYKICSFKK